MVKKRERLEIIKDILSSVKSKGEIKPTRLLYASNLSPQMFKKYIGVLLERKLIEEIEIKKRKYFSLTDKGLRFLGEYKIIVNFIETFGI